MKKISTLFSAIAIPMMAFASITTPPQGVKLIPDIYAWKISHNGEWIATSTAVFYNVKTGETLFYNDECTLGLGSPIANNGVSVGAYHNSPLIFKGEDMISPETLLKYSFCDLSSITTDGTKLCGYLSTDDDNPVSYVPFVADIDEDGNISEPQMLPYPTVDFFGMAPQLVNTIWISDDGKTVSGNVLDARGSYYYPIIFTQNDNGKWSYSLPSEDLFNPEGIDIPENPWKTELPYPEPEEFMSGLRLTAYQMEYAKYAEGLGEEPNPLDFMTEAQQQAYKAAVDEYNDWYFSHEQAMKDYNRIYNQVINTSPLFSSNDQVLSSDGTVLIANAMYGVMSDEPTGYILKFVKGTNDIERYLGPNAEIVPLQYFDNGTFTVTLPKMVIPTTWIVLPGTKDFIPVQDFIQPKYPEATSWINSNFPNGSGVVSFSDDFTVMAGAVSIDQQGIIDEDDAITNTYLLTNLELAGIESIVSEPNDGVYRVYNLQGVKMLDTKDVSAISALPDGIYIINGKKYLKK